MRKCLQSLANLLVLDAMTENACPVCGYTDLFEPPRGEAGEASFEICPSCGTEFGCDDFEVSHEALRIKWLEGGAKWYATHQQMPEGWDGKTQCENAFKA
jgi:uncharacterized Zn finger protein (UPF0148 family)